MPEKLGPLLVNKNIISAEQLQKAIEKQKDSGEQLASALVQLGFVKEEGLLSFLSRHYEIPSLNLHNYTLKPEVIKLIPPDLAYKYLIFPLSLRGTTLLIAMADPSNIFAIDDVKFLTGYRIEVCAATETTIRKLLDEQYDLPARSGETPVLWGSEGIDFSKEGKTIDANERTSSCGAAPVITLVNEMLRDAIKMGASDIHIEPYEKALRIRFRIDGVLYHTMNPPIHFKNTITSRIKIMAKLDIAERRLPQDGRIQVTRENGEKVDFRVSVLPTIFGEKVVLRLLDKSHLQLDMTKLGFEADELKHFQQVIHYPFGMVLVTGPTGSGKTTTLYSALNALNRVSENISTVEDPVEYNLAGVNQVQIHEEIGLTFATVLRALLRQDPDIILVGEIRDYTTAEIAIKAALTGHLVLSTLHTNDAPSAVNRLVQMGIEPYLISSSLMLIVAQRLVRKICPACKTLMTIPDHACTQLAIGPEDYDSTFPYRGTGCANCNNSGFKGRIAIYELMLLNNQIKQFILKGVSSGDLKKEAIKSGMSTLKTSAIKKMKQGLTTPEEVLRITHI
jgi:type IV pilus assembly protein PilB